jgi:hypothetical protein
MGHMAAWAGTAGHGATSLPSQADSQLTSSGPAKFCLGAIVRMVPLAARGTAGFNRRLFLHAPARSILAT